MTCQSGPDGNGNTPAGEEPEWSCSVTDPVSTCLTGQLTAGCLCKVSLTLDFISVKSVQSEFVITLPGVR